MVQAERGSSHRAIAWLLLGSGLAALVYQTAWQRLFRLVFGATTAASAAVLAVFLGGLGVGGVLLGKRAEQTERPLELYGNLELGVTLFAALSPLTVDLAARIYLALGVSGGGVWPTTVRLLVALLVMGPPAVLMGGTLPAAARAAESDDDRGRTRLALLYALNTGGAVIGALLGTFVLFEVLGTQLSLWFACGVNALVGVIARSLARRQPPAPIGPPADEPADTDEPRAPRLVYVAAGLVGFVFIALELVWYRVLAPLLGGSTYTFGLVLALALLGVGLGGALYARRDPDAAPDWRLLAWTLALEALAAGVPLALGDTLALYSALTRPLGVLGFGGSVLSWTLIAAIVVLPASIAAGYQFPVLMALIGRGRAAVAEHVGFAYAANTLGSVLGSLITGFWLIPHAGVVVTWRAVVIVLAVLAALGLARARRVAWPVVVALGLAVLAARSEGPGAVWRHSAVGAGRAGIPGGGSNDFLEWRRQREFEVAWVKDGLDSSVALGKSNGYAFLVNGKSDGSLLGDRATQVMSGLLAALLHPAPRHAFVVGLGTGSSAGWLAQVPGIERVDVAEIESAVLDVARASAPVNRDVLASPKVNVQIADGREWLRGTSERYDVIFSEPSNLYRAGVASLFTADFYRATERRLADGGIFAQWLQGYEIGVDTVLTVLASLKSVYPCVEIWETQTGDLLMLASREPRTYDVARITERVHQEPYATALMRAWYVDSAEGVFAHLIANEAVVARLVEQGGWDVATDDLNPIEFRVARTLGSSADAATQLRRLGPLLGATPSLTGGTLDAVRLRDLRPRAYLMNLVRPRADERLSPRAAAVIEGCEGDGRNVAAIWEQLPEAARAPSDPLERYVVALGRARKGDEGAATEAAALVAAGFAAEGHLVLGVLRHEQHRAPESVAALVQGAEALRDELLPLCNVPAGLAAELRSAVGADQTLARQAIAALSVGPFLVYAGERARVEALQNLALALGEPDTCVPALGEHLERPWWDEDFLVGRALCLRRAGHARAAAAEADVVRYRMNEGGQLNP